MGSVLLLMLLGLMTSVNSIRQTSMRGTHQSADECEKQCGGKYNDSDSNAMFSMIQRPPKWTQFTWKPYYSPNILLKPEDDIKDCDHPCYGRQHQEMNLNIVKDTFVVASDCANRARCTLPTGMIIDRSGIPGAGLGVWLEKLIPNGTYLGPYEGDIYYLNSDDKPKKSGYSWFVCCKRKNYFAKFLIDGYNVRRSNWMRYINCARNVHEKNLVVFYYKDKVYYKSNRDIQPGEELLVFYGRGYAHTLGIDMDTYYL